MYKNDMLSCIEIIQGFLFSVSTLNLNPSQSSRGIHNILGERKSIRGRERAKIPFFFFFFFFFFFLQGCAQGAKSHLPTYFIQFFSCSFAASSPGYFSFLVSWNFVRESFPMRSTSLQKVTAKKFSFNVCSALPERL